MLKHEGQFKKGHAGRPKGSKNKTSAALAQTMLDALDELGGKAWLVKVGRDKPGTLMPVIAKLLPKDVNMNVSGKLTIEETIALADADLPTEAPESPSKPSS